MQSLMRYVEEGFHDHKSPLYFRFEKVIAIVTIVSILSIVLESVHSLLFLHPVFLLIEWFSVLFFTLEYFGRVLTTRGKWQYVLSFWGIVDVLAVLPTYLHLGNFTFLKSVRILRVLRLVRLLRLIKVIRMYTETIHGVDSEEEANKQNIRIYFFTLVTCIVLSGSVLYAIEHNQPAYENIPKAMLQGAKILVGGLAISLPQTLAGEIVVVVIRFIGLALFGLLIAIVGGSLHQLIFGEKKK